MRNHYQGQNCNPVTNKMEASRVELCSGLRGRWNHWTAGEWIASRDQKTWCVYVRMFIKLPHNSDWSNSLNLSDRSRLIHLEYPSHIFALSFLKIDYALAFWTNLSQPSYVDFAVSNMILTANNRSNMTEDSTSFSTVRYCPKMSLEGMRQVIKTRCLIDGFCVENSCRKRPMVCVYVCVCACVCLLQLFTLLPSSHLYTQLDTILH
jgi:hypothetical protein